MWYFLLSYLSFNVGWWWVAVIGLRNISVFYDFSSLQNTNFSDGWSIWTFCNSVDVVWVQVNQQFDISTHSTFAGWTLIVRKCSKREPNWIVASYCKSYSSYLIYTSLVHDYNFQSQSNLIRTTCSFFQIKLLCGFLILDFCLFLATV